MAKGSLCLINPAGVVVGTCGMVRTGGSFVASTHDASDADFLNGGEATYLLAEKLRDGYQSGCFRNHVADIIDPGKAVAADLPALLLIRMAELVRDFERASDFMSFAGNWRRGRA